jgi:hypothetical protein
MILSRPMALQLACRIMLDLITTTSSLSTGSLCQLSLCSEILCVQTTYKDAMSKSEASLRVCTVVVPSMVQPILWMLDIGLLNACFRSEHRSIHMAFAWNAAAPCVKMIRDSPEARTFDE